MSPTARRGLRTWPSRRAGTSDHRRGGERQLIALTRAYLPPARLVILDEATCHLDPTAEEQAETAFSRRGGTLVVIAHRISSARRARRTLVLDGDRPHVGDHSSLLASSEMYADLAGQWETPHYPERTVAPLPQAVVGDSQLR